MSLLPADIRAELETICRRDVPLTDLAFARLTADQSRSFGHRASELKGRIFENSRDRFRSATSFAIPEPIPTSLDRIFGGPLRRGEVTSIEGGSGSGKTRMVVKLAHEVSIAGRVLFIDADLTLQPHILSAIEASLGLENAVVRSFSLEEESNFVILPVNSIVDLYSAINAYLRSERPDLIVIDSMMSLFQSSMLNDGPGSALVQQTALELKHLARDVNCVIVVTNVLKQDSRSPQPFLGRLYTSLWHQRVVMTTANHLTVKVELVQSPRHPYQAAKIMIENLIDCPPEAAAAFEDID